MVAFYDRNVSQDNTDVLQGPPIVDSITINILKAKQAAIEEVESVVHEEVSYTTKDLNEFANGFKWKSGKYL